ncbi:3-deoxy-D-manno-octulosonate cytidylyltransferase [Fulvimarina pelagi HTCC2506]|uniref:3-deoxy-manno-octulosonate cytidylyltransferase n=1 Tax=Fulvimarina pelagi HTCC2506 TaxID=314231 RepID=Q0G7J1_9HYPH|nr:3-deoxy-manno-octulosonate cytidylyltransferase [Fulvimarina pelagi]EAU42373.1 3-deoxy-D-manno-octulosonate cytidylyltransferase [Fulvimarina pelagi HTCC2506]
MATIAIIPCRYGASRFPGKPLSDIHGKPMLWHVYHQATKAPSIDRVIIATDDDRIYQKCEILGLEVMMTRGDHVSGTDRVAECASRLDGEVFVNVQGDEPMIEPEAIERVAKAILESTDENIVASNGFNEMCDPSDVIDTNVVKVVMRQDGRALAYSRMPIPFPKGGKVQYFRQLGLYAFRKHGLERFVASKPGPLEMAEGVEMFRFLEHGYDVNMVQVPNDRGIPVDTPSDLERVRAMMARG